MLRWLQVIIAGVILSVAAGADFAVAQPQIFVAPVEPPGASAVLVREGRDFGTPATITIDGYHAVRLSPVSTARDPRPLADVSDPAVAFPRLDSSESWPTEADRLGLIGRPLEGSVPTTAIVTPLRC